MYETSGEIEVEMKALWARLDLLKELMAARVTAECASKEAMEHRDLLLKVQGFVGQLVDMIRADRGTLPDSGSDLWIKSSKVIRHLDAILQEVTDGL